MEVVRQISGVLFVLFLLGAMLWALRRQKDVLHAVFRRRTHSQAHSFQVMGRVILTPNHSLHIVRAGAREWVVVTHPYGCTVINEGSATGAPA
jgi:flagellar biogenesis protein FliO